MPIVGEVTVPGKPTIGDIEVSDDNTVVITWDTPEPVDPDEEIKVPIVFCVYQCC